jgi:hypothetical protein
MLLAISLNQTPASWAALGAVVGLLILLRIGGAKFTSLLIGEDGRTSTSKFQALLWTVALAWALLALTLQGKTDFNIVPDYLALLGFPALALVFAKGIVQQKLEQGDIAKPPPASDKPDPNAQKIEQAQTQVQDAKAQVDAAVAADDSSKAVAAAKEATSLASSATHAASAVASTNTSSAKRSFLSYIGDLVNNDSGQPDIVDFQYLTFNLVAATYFFINFINHNALPGIPDTLVALTGASAATYVTNKALLKQKPILTGVAPASAKPGDEITLRGTNLAGPGTNPDGTAAVTEVKFDTTSVAPTLANDKGVTVAVPSDVDGYTAGTPKHAHISVLNAAGLESNQVPFTIS